MEYRENNIEFYTNQETATASFTQLKMVHKMEQLAEIYPDECQIVAKNDDGSILVHFPVSWISVRRPVHRELTDEQRQELAERIKYARGQKDVKNN